jgi:photosystem II stability/assembly factor-like uncharacterized protein
VPVLAIAPSDSNVIYAGTIAGMARSDNAGKNWRYLKSTKGKITFRRPDNYRCIAIDSRDYNKLFVGTKSGRVYFSKNGGKTWRHLKGKRYPFAKKIPITALCLTRDSKKLFTASESGLLQYDLQNKKWKKITVNLGKVWDIVSLDGQKGETIYVTAGKRVAYSTDYGNAWQYTRSIPKGKAARLSVYKDSSGNVRIVVGWRKGWKGGVFLSLDSGKTWKNVEKNLKHDEQGNPTRAWAKNMGKANSVAFDPFNPEIMYFSDWWGVWRSDDNGKSWSERIQGAPNTVGSDIHITSLGEIYVATMDDGLFKSTDGGESYKAIFPKKGYRKDINGHVWRVTSDPKNPQKIIATSSPWNMKVNQIIISQNGGESFDIVRNGLPAKRPKINTMWSKGFPRALALDPERPNIVYLGIDGNDGGGLYISNDGGLHWKYSEKPPEPKKSRNVFGHIFDWLQRYSEGQPSSKRIYNALAVDPTNPDRLFWGACGDDGGIYRSDDNGKTWRQVFFASNWIFDIAISKTGIIYAAGSRKRKPVLYVSKNQGRSWRSIFKLYDRGSCEAICIDPNDEKRIFMGTVKWHHYPEGNIFYSDNSGKHWKNITAGLPVSSGPAAMTIDPKENMLYLLLGSGSAYKLNIDKL